MKHGFMYKMWKQNAVFTPGSKKFAETKKRLTQVQACPKEL
jgi:hypothetical protein